jgi:CoA:oxalate CoA-transferase
VNAATATDRGATARGLAGVRVLDFGRFIAAPYCTMLLADLGAEVIRVERPNGEDDRLLGLRAPHGEAYTFAGLARAKRAVTLDVAAGPSARAVLADLVAHCDVFVHNFGPAAAEALGLTYEDIRGMRLDVVYAGISSNGSSGPHATRTGFDPIAQMASGAAALTGQPAGVPTRSGVPWVDFSTGLAAAFGVVTALRHRDATGEGQAVDCSLLRTALSYTAPMVAEAVVGGCERPRLGNQAAYIAPSNLYPCRDGHVYVAAVSRTTWRALAGLIGEPEFAVDPKLATPELRFGERERIDEAIAAWTATRTVRQATQELAGAGVPNGPLQSTRDVVDDEQVRAEELLGHVDLGLPGLDRVPAPASPVRFSGLPAAIGGCPPSVGEHNVLVYGELLGYRKARLAALQAAGVV